VSASGVCVRLATGGMSEQIVKKHGGRANSFSFVWQRYVMNCRVLLRKICHEERLQRFLQTKH
jgi:hypothetical protein